MGIVEVDAGIKLMLGVNGFVGKELGIAVNSGGFFKLWSGCDDCIWLSSGAEMSLEESWQGIYI